MEKGTKKVAVVRKKEKPSMGSSRKGCMRGKGGPENATCTYRGVRQRTWGKWVAEIGEPNCGARLWLGTFNTSLEAALAYDDAARKLYGGFANLNLPPDHHRPSRSPPPTTTITTNHHDSNNISTSTTKVGDDTDNTSVMMDQNFIDGANSVFSDGGSSTCLWESPSTLSSTVTNWPDLSLESTDFYWMSDLGVSKDSEEFVDGDGLQVPWS